MSAQQTFERQFMEEEIDSFDFILAETFGMPVEHMQQILSNREYLQWRAFYNWRAAQQELDTK